MVSIKRNPWPDVGVQTCRQFAMEEISNNPANCSAVNTKADICRRFPGIMFSRAAAFEVVGRTGKAISDINNCCGRLDKCAQFAGLETPDVFMASLHRRNPSRRGDPLCESWQALLASRKGNNFPRRTSGGA